MSAQKTKISAGSPTKKPLASGNSGNKARAPAQMSWEASPPAKKSNFGFFSVFFRIIVAVLIVAGAALVARGMIEGRPEPVERKAFERSFTVSVMDAELTTHTPNISAYGEIGAAQTLNIRAPAAGDVIYVAPNLRAGGLLQAGQVLVKVDPFDYELSLSDAKTALEDARSALAEAEEQLRIQQLNVDYAQNSLELAQTDLTRAKALFDAGSLTSQQLEARELIVSQRDQSLRQAQSNIVLQEAMISRRMTAIETAARNVERATRALAETTISTPYDAVVISSNVVPGATFSQGEAVASVYQADALEVRFTLSELQYGQLLASGLIGREVEAVWEIQPTPIVLKGAISRIGAQVNATLGGIEIFATLQSSPDATIWPGTFVSVNLPGISYEDALRIPETALYADGNFYVVQNKRMKSVPAQILARDGENVIVQAPVSPGDRIITTRLAQAGEGVLVSIEGEEPTGEDIEQPSGVHGTRPAG
ncbi:MAG TPA: HlyD family efflux transporter periplasmic adaptor subunit [Devosia sp.]|nr:HlyD family efflux transporter periplasmic adaptor subunit [Devosia sp.]